MKKILYAFLLSSILTSFFAHAGLTSICDPQQDLGTYVSYIDKITNESSSAGAGADSFYSNVKATLKEGQSGYWDMLKPSHFRFEMMCDGPCTYESEAVFMKLQRGIKIKANDIFKSSRAYDAEVNGGRSNMSLALGLRNDLNFNGFFNGKKITPDLNSIMDDLVKEAKSSKKLLTSEKIESISELTDFFGKSFGYDQKKVIIDTLKQNPRKTFIINYFPYDKNEKALTPHSVNIISEGGLPTSKVIVVSNGRITKVMDFKDLTEEGFREAIIGTHSDGDKINDFYYAMFWE